VAESRTYVVRLLSRRGDNCFAFQVRIRSRLGNAIRALAADPRPPGCRKLVGGTDYFRIRVGDYPVLYEVRDRDVLVLVIKIRHRGEVYR
jgi:mRNA interferase RelE/StbE